MIKNYFTVDIAVKRYVKRYLELNCGMPADLSHLPKINDFFLNKLKHPSRQREGCASQCAASLSEDDFIQIKISEDVFYRHGWEMTKTNQRQFNMMVEREIKFLWRNFIATNTSIGVPVARCIREFQYQFNLGEDFLKYDTIKKDYDRNGKVIKGVVILSFRSEINRILLDGMADLGTISKSYKNECNKQACY